MYYTYALLCTDKAKKQEIVYIGFTEDLTNRLKEHQNGEVLTTKKFDYVDLVYYEACLNKADARRRELQLKTGFGRGYLKRRLESYFKDTRD
jgi:putative endonuclease